MALEAELSYYDAHKDELLDRYSGQFVVIHGEELLGAFGTFDDAYAAAVQRVGNQPFLIRQVVKHEPAAQFPALSVGMLSAHP